MTKELLTEFTVLDYLRARGVIDASAAQALLLGGGVSNVVIAVDQGSTRLVVKQALPRLRVEAEWLAPVDRAITEGKAIILSAEILQSGPTLRDSDHQRFTITMDRADDGWQDWKSFLFADRIDITTAAEVGRQIAMIHSATAGGSGLDPDFFRTEPFELLRLAPYYDSTAEKAPAQAAAIRQLADDLRSRRSCLVHGDLAPKNILVSPTPGEAWLIDWEVAHYGDPAFDLAFLLTHLTMKSIHLAPHREALDASVTAFANAYEREFTGARVEWSRVLLHVGCLLMARVFGKSPAEYLDDRSRPPVVELGRALLDGDSTDLADLRTLRDRFTQ